MSSFPPCCSYWRLTGSFTIGLVQVLKVFVAKLVSANQGSDLGVTNVVELFHETGRSQAEETLDCSWERRHGEVVWREG